MWEFAGPGTTMPTRLKIYAPNGEAKVVVGWLQMHYSPPPKEVCRMALTELDGNTTMLNGLVVVKDVENEVVAYNPRKPPPPPPFAEPGLSVLTPAEREWLANNPSWPRELELDWNQVDQEDS